LKLQYLPAERYHLVGDATLDGTLALPSANDDRLAQAGGPGASFTADSVTGALRRGHRLGCSVCDVGDERLFELGRLNVEIVAAARERQLEIALA
jgi:hypothetical protein